MLLDPWMDTTWLDDYQGLSADQAIELAQRQKRMYRVIRPDDPITTDLSKQRLNIVLREDGSLIGFRAG
jgi:hypothetical protein